MISDVARAVRPLFSSPEAFSALLVWVESRIKTLSEQLHSAPDMETVLRIQGQISELKRLRTLRDEVQAEIDRDRQ